MWKMFDDNIQCDECGGPPEPPPKFMIPPPPRPPSLADPIGSNCNEEEMLLKAQRSWDSDMCEAIPIFDASLYSNHTLQTSVIIAVFTLLLILVVLISSLFVWKNKRKVQNFLPCKTPTRGPHINGGLPIGSVHSVTYEDPDAHLGHRPLVMRPHHHHHHHHHHHNVEMLHGKGIHYPSGYPMTRSPPFLVSSSPGPDPYRSNDNVYEELGPGRDSDGESEPPMHSDDDFAEDELSLPGERSFNKSTASETASTLPVSTIYHERTTLSNGGGATSGCAAGQERSSLLSSSSSTSHTHDASTATASLSASSSNNNHFNSLTSATATATAVGSTTRSNNSGGGILSGVLRHTTGRSKFGGALTMRKNSQKTTSMNEFNTNNVSSVEIPSDVVSVSPLYDNRSNLMALTCSTSNHSHHPSHHHKQQSGNHHFHSLHHLNSNHINNNSNSTSNNNNNNNSTNSSNNNNNNNNCSNSLRPSIQFYNTLESEVERRNRINHQLHQAPGTTPVTPVSTIFRERINYLGTVRYPSPHQPYCSTSSGTSSTTTNGSGLASGNLLSSMRSRTNPRCIERRRITAPIEPIEPTYGYAEPIFHEAYLYDTCSATVTPSQPQLQQHQHQQHRIASQMSYPAYIMPDYTSAAAAAAIGSGGGLYRSHSNHHPYQNPSAGSQIYSRDSSFGSDSGYSHHTPSSSIGRYDYDVASVPPPPPPLTKFTSTTASTAMTTTTTTTTATTQKPTSKLASALSFGWNRKATAKSGNSHQENFDNVAGAPPPSTTILNAIRTSSDRSPNNNSGRTTVTEASSTVDSTASTTTTSSAINTIPNGGCNNNLSTAA